MAEKGPGMATLRFTCIIVCAVLLGQGSPEKTGECFTKAYIQYLYDLLIARCWLKLSVTVLFQEVVKTTKETPFFRKLFQNGVKEAAGILRELLQKQIRISLCTLG